MHLHSNELAIPVKLFMNITIILKCYGYNYSFEYNLITFDKFIKCDKIVKC